MHYERLWKNIAGTCPLNKNTAGRYPGTPPPRGRPKAPFASAYADGAFL
jgi:hypothetical protein